MRPGFPREPESLLTVGDLREALRAFRSETPVWFAIFGEYHRINTVVSTEDNRAVLAPHFYPGDHA